MSLSKEDLGNIESIVDRVVTNKVTNFATKDDLDRMEGRLTTAIGLLQRDSFTRLDQHETRIARLEKAIGS